MRPRLAGSPTFRRLHGKLSPRLTGLPYLADRETRLGGSPHLSCKRDQNKLRIYKDRRVTPPTRVTSPTQGPPPPCKQALKIGHRQGKNCTITSRNTSCWVCLVDFDGRWEIMSLSDKTVVAHNTVKPLMIKTNLWKGGLVPRVPCSKFREKLQEFSQSVCVLFGKNNTVKYFNLFVCPFK